MIALFGERKTLHIMPIDMLGKETMCAFVTDDLVIQSEDYDFTEMQKPVSNYII